MPRHTSFSTGASTLTRSMTVYKCYFNNNSCELLLTYTVKMHADTVYYSVIIVVVVCYHIILYR